jgi:glycosyltransferase involved in cell wall biosynthesis
VPEADGDANVDVILPTRNRFDLTLRAAGSVLAQTFHDWNLWVVDDASDDGSAERLRTPEGIGDLDPRVRLLVRRERGGPASARQSGLEAGRAPWVALIDSDDRWEPDRLKRQLEAVRLEGDSEEAKPVDAVFAWHRWRDETGRETVSEIPVRQWKRFPMLTNNFSTLLLRRNVLEACGGFVVGQPLSTCENLDLCLRLTGLKLEDRWFGRWGVLVVPEVLATCFSHGGERSSDLLRSRMAADELAVLVKRSESTLRRYPEIRSRLLAQAGGRYVASQQYRKGIAAFGRAMVPRGDRKGAFLRNETVPILRRVATSFRPSRISKDTITVPSGRPENAE